MARLVSDGWLTSSLTFLLVGGLLALTILASDKWLTGVLVDVPARVVGTDLGTLLLIGGLGDDWLTLLHVEGLWGLTGLASAD